jgi:FkbH-like protein
LQNALEPFEKHPEMVLRRDDIASFQANWDPKSDNIIRIANELNLSLDSFVFIDDNPAEIDIIRQFVPAVTALWLGPDPAAYVQRLQDSRLFETRQITEEDTIRVEQYRQDAHRKESFLVTEDMDSYLESLQMLAHINDFAPIDVPRLSQLINKSNQFNLTTKRRTEAEVAALIDSEHVCFSLRLQDRFGDLGLVAVVIAIAQGTSLVIDTWLMSCRVLKRQVEHSCLNELMRRAKDLGCSEIIGVYLPTTKNGMVKDFYSLMGFTKINESSERTEYKVSVPGFQAFHTKISVIRGNNDKE